ncbi:MAG: hypothetical protein JST54_24420 [Deltaproteobacteria bacterium]|nr:hypothetical protein [Deltaproteobacteria bacterium]
MSTDWDSEVERLRRQTASLTPSEAQLQQWSALANRPAPSVFSMQLARTCWRLALAAGVAAAVILAVTWPSKAQREELAMQEASWMP